MWRLDVFILPHLLICSVLFQPKRHSVNSDSTPHLLAAIFSNHIGSLFCRISQRSLSMAEMFMIHLSFFLLLPRFGYSRPTVFVSHYMVPIPASLYSLLFGSCGSGPCRSNGWPGDNFHALRSVQSSFLVIGGQFSSVGCNFHPAGNLHIMAIQSPQLNTSMFPK